MLWLVVSVVIAAASMAALVSDYDNRSGYGEVLGIVCVSAIVAAICIASWLFLLGNVF